MRNISHATCTQPPTSAYPASNGPGHTLNHRVRTNTAHTSRPLTCITETIPRGQRPQRTDLHTPTRRTQKAARSLFDGLPRSPHGRTHARTHAPATRNIAISSLAVRLTALRPGDYVSQKRLRRRPNRDAASVGLCASAPSSGSRVRRYRGGSAPGAAGSSAAGTPE